MSKQKTNKQWQDVLLSYNPSFVNGEGDAKKQQAYSVLTENIRRPLGTETGRNNNVCVIGSSTTDRAEHFAVPNIENADCNYVVFDPEGLIYDKIKDTLVENNYIVSVLNLCDAKQSNHYNPFVYLKTEADIAAFVEAFLGYAYRYIDTDNDCRDIFPYCADLIKAILYYMIDFLPTKERTPLTLLYALMGEPITIGAQKRTFSEIVEMLQKTDPHNIIVEKYKSFQDANIDNEILTTIRREFGTFSWRYICPKDVSDEMELDNLRNAKKAIFIIYDVATDEYDEFKMVARMLIGQSVALLNTNKRISRHTRFILNDANLLYPYVGTDHSSSYLSQLLHMSTTAKPYSFCILFNDILYLQYGFYDVWEKIINCCDGLLYFGGENLATMEFFSQLIASYCFDKAAKKRNLADAVLCNPALGTEIKMPLQADTCLLFLNDEQPIYDKKPSNTRH